MHLNLLQNDLSASSDVPMEQNVKLTTGDYDEIAGLIKKIS